MESDRGKVTWKKRLWVAYFGATACWALNAYILLGQWLDEGNLLARKIDGRPYISDFINSYSAAVLARECLEKPVRIYDQSVQDALQRKLVAPNVPEQTFYNQYPPVEFVLFMPLAFLSAPHAWICWCIFSAILSVAVICAVVLPSISDKFGRLIAVSAFFAAYPTWLSFELGQPSLLLFPVLLGCWFLLKHRRFALAGILMSLLMVKLQYLPMMAAIGLALGGVPFLGGFLSASAILVALSVLVLGWNNVMDFPHAILTNEVSAHVSGVSADKMQDVRGILTLILGDTGLVHVLSGAFYLAAIIAMFVIWKRFAPKGASQFDLLAGITILVMLFFSPHTHIQDYIIALLSCIWFYLIGIGCDARFRPWLVAGSVSFPIIGWFFFFGMPFLQLVKVQPFALWAAAFAAYCFVLYFKMRQSASADDNAAV